ncbi:MAG TPA: thiamine diphosphokinase [Clostridiaceae bacterium]|nr:thiamine diphosphokinase [Clostridiaceae bacterium]
MTGIVICNGSITDYEYYKRYFDDVQLIVCADGGALHAIKMGVKPHILVGDLDSLRNEVLKWFENTEVEIVHFPVEKDMTDSELAINIAADRGCTYIKIIGGFGSRLDHSLANIFLLKKLLDKGIKASIINENNEITLIKDKITLQKREGYNVSLIPISEKAEGVTLKGFYYPLQEATIEMGSTWGISNEFVDETAEVTIKSGLMLVILSRK